MREAEFVNLREAEMAGGSTVALATVDGSILPVVTELAGVEHRDEFLVVQDGFDGRYRPRVVRELGDGGRGILTAIARLGAARDVRED